MDPPTLASRTIPFAAGLLFGVLATVTLRPGTSATPHAADPSCRTVCTSQPGDVITVGPRAEPAPAPAPLAPLAYTPPPPAPRFAPPAPAPAPTPEAAPAPPPAPFVASPAVVVAPPPAPRTDAARADVSNAVDSAAPPAAEPPPSLAWRAASAALERGELTTALGEYMMMSSAGPMGRQREALGEAIRASGAQQLTGLVGTDCARAQALFRMLRGRGVAPDGAALFTAACPVP